MILLIYVNDLFFTREEKLISDCKKKLTKGFKMKDIGMMHSFLGLEVWQQLDEIFLNQGKYVVEILKRFWMLDCKAMNTPMVTNLKLLNDDSSDTMDVMLYRLIILSLMYMMNTRPYICFVANTMSEYMVEP